MPANGMTKFFEVRAFQRDIKDGFVSEQDRLSPGPRHFDVANQETNAVRRTLPKKRRLRTPKAMLGLLEKVNPSKAKIKISLIGPMRPISPVLSMKKLLFLRNRQVKNDQKRPQQVPKKPALIEYHRSRH